MKRAVGAFVMVSSVVMVGIPSNAMAARTFSSCDDLHRVFPYGVAKGKAPAKRAVREGYSRPATSKRAKKVYWANHGNLDRDKDGVACES